ncbi:MAG: aminotransferase class I/II-fold pyridoxal phosphate-dependent enzyme [Candidatus Zixiibacteriota bacterium]
MAPLTRKILLDRTDRMQRLGVPSMDLEQTALRLGRREVEIIDLSRLTVSGTLTAREVDSVAVVSERGSSDWQEPTEADFATLTDAFVRWYDHRFGVALDPAREVVAAPNPIVGLFSLSLAFVEAGDLVLLPDPGAAFYRGTIVLAGGGAVPYHLWERNDYLPSFPGLEAGLVGRTRMMVLSHPHNPTTAAADVGVHVQAVAFARQHQVLLAHDSAFTFAVDGAFRPRSFLQTHGAKGVGVEISPIGVNFGLTNLPVTFVCGNRDAVAAAAFLLQRSGLHPSRAALRVAQHLLEHAEEILARRTGRLKASRQLLTETAVALGWNPRSSPTAPFLWIAIPTTLNSEAFCRRILRRTGILLNPGTAFGERGEGFVRMAIPEDHAVAVAAAERLQRHARFYQRPLPRHRPLRVRRRNRPPTPT